MNDTGSTRLLRIRASAGSGKTHALTARFLALLAQANASVRPPVCAAAVPRVHAWPEILAVTFTNKAATEMKERIVRELKLRALGDTTGAAGKAWSETEARACLDRILARYQSLGVRTIDSLVCMLARVFALRLGLPPDFTVVFDMEELFTPVFEEFVAECDGEDAHGAALLEQAASTLLEHERKDGFQLRATLLGRLLDMVELFRFSPPNLEYDQAALAEILRPAYDAFRQALEDLRASTEQGGLELHANFVRALDKCAVAQLFDGPPKSAYFDKPSLAECVLKASKSRVTHEHEGIFLRFADAEALYRQEHALLAGAYALAPCVALAARLGEALAERAAAKGSLPLATVYDLVGDLLRTEGAVSGAYCRLGARLTHLCLDEFQDTSREQWRTLDPLALEALAKGGSLFCVGDAKQAIYGWRGGDATLFDEVGSKRLAAPAGGVHDESLPYNWRSRREIIDFNNAFFSALADPQTAEALADFVFAKAPADARDAFAQATARTFADCTQSQPPSRPKPGGVVHLERLPEDDGEEDGETGGPLRPTLIAVVEDAATRRGPGDVAVLVRSNDQAALVSDWLMARGLPVITENSLHLNRHPTVRQIASFLAFLDYPLDDAAFAAFISGSLFLAESGFDAQRIHDLFAARGRDPLYIAFRAAFPRVWEILIEPFFRKSGLVRPYDMAAEVAAAFRAAEREPGSELFVRRFLEIVHLAEENGAGSLAAFLEFWAEHGEEEKAPLPGNVEAVRVMTIHKAKGLQFPVVVVPFHDFSAARVDTPHEVVSLRNSTFLAPIRGAAVGEPHWKVRDRMARESLNLLYVAWTRAEEELYGFLPSGTEAVSSPVLAAIQVVLGDDLADGVMTRGQRTKATKPYTAAPMPAPHALPPRDEPTELMAWLPRLRVYRHAVHGAADAEAARRGEAAHRAMDLLASGLDPAAAAARAVNEFLPGPHAPGARERAVGEIAEMTAWAGELPELREAIARGRREAALIDERGATHRVDLLHADASGTLVVEYKTGGAAPAHLSQVRRYLALCAAMPDLPRPLRGLLVYLDERRTAPVIVETP